MGHAAISDCMYGTHVTAVCLFICGQVHLFHDWEGVDVGVWVGTCVCLASCMGLGTLLENGATPPSSSILATQSEAPTSDSEPPVVEFSLPSREPEAGPAVGVGACHGPIALAFS